MNKTYHVEQHDQNSWTVDWDGNCHPIVLWDCGHYHRSVGAAYRCQQKLAGYTRSIGAKIKHTDGDDLTGAEERDLDEYIRSNHWWWNP